MVSVRRATLQPWWPFRAQAAEAGPDQAKGPKEPSEHRQHRARGRDRYKLIGQEGDFRGREPAPRRNKRVSLSVEGFLAHFQATLTDSEPIF